MHNNCRPDIPAESFLMQQSLAEPLTMIGQYYTYARHSIKAVEWRYTEHDEMNFGLDNTTSKISMQEQNEMKVMILTSFSRADSKSESSSLTL